MVGLEATDHADMAEALRFDLSGDRASIHQKPGGFGAGQAAAGPPFERPRDGLGLLARASIQLRNEVTYMAFSGGLSDEAVRAIEEVVSGDFSDSQNARARLDAARVILGAIGVREQAQASATANVVVSLGDGLRARCLLPQVRCRRMRRGFWPRLFRRGLIHAELKWDAFPAI